MRGGEAPKDSDGDGMPDAWEEGSITGLCAKGGFEVDIVWKEGQPQEITIHSKSGERCNLRYGESTLSFNTRKERSYKVVLRNGKLRRA